MLKVSCIAPVIAVVLFPPSAVRAADAQLAVASNFAVPAKRLAAEFSAASGHKLTLSNGSTGKLYAQIRAGAPFDVLLSADEETPRRLEAEKLAVAGTRFTYAVGTLVLWSPKARLAVEDILRKAQFSRLALANPRLAPYGVAARETLENLGLWESVHPKLVQGENIAQTFQFVWSGNAELGFVALSQLHDSPSIPGSHWVVPERLHTPLRQDAVLLRENEAARAFLDYLKTAPARQSIRSYGYQ